MINQETIGKIFDTARIDEVVGDFVTLKKRGVNLLGLCPFHNEKTPSFTVSPAKGIYKCFGCGKGGNAVNFIMEHEQLTYPEALRYLARKYNIEIEEEEYTPEQEESKNERESLMVVLSFAQKHFTENLFDSKEGKAIGLSYFTERGFRKDIVEKFQLGYCFDNREAFASTALKLAYQKEYLVKSGLCIEREQDGSIFDRFAGRVMFPVHNISGRVIAFGGRTLKTDKKIAKYINSPETDVYHKSNVLYGIYFAKKEIVAQDNCYLVEGYTDVISLHQAGIENVVASSGTSLTVEQIRLIRRYTKNITILYDGDAAGIKASFRGINLVLEEGMNVKVLLFPDGEDPDSFSKKVNGEELQQFIAENTKDFIAFKTNLLYEDAQKDPIQKAAFIKDIVETIAVIPEAITRSLYIKECSSIMEIEEQVLLNELNKVRRKNFTKKQQKAARVADSDEPVVATDALLTSQQPVITSGCKHQEHDIIRLMLQYGQEEIFIEDEDEEGNKTSMPIKVVEFIIDELSHDRISFENPQYQSVFNLFVQQKEEGNLPGESFFIHHPDPAVSKLAVDILSMRHALSDWERHGILVQTEEQVLKKSVLSAIFSLKVKKIEEMIASKQKQLKEIDSDEHMLELLRHHQQLNEAKKRFNDLLGRIVIK